MTPEEQMALLNYMGMGAYGSPLMSSAASQLNLVQDIGSMAFDTVFMYNMGLITPEQLLSSIQNATREPVGDATEYDWESTYDSIVGSGEDELINGVNTILSGSQTAAQFIRGLRSRMAEEGAYDLNPSLNSIIDSIEKDLEEFETKYNNANFIKQKVDSGEYEFDQSTGMVYKPVLGEDARENLRAAGWKGPFQDPEFWRTIPDFETMNQAAKLQEQFSPLLEAYDKDQEVISRGTREELAKKSPAIKKLLELKPETAQQGEYTTRGWKNIEDAYNKAMKDFNIPSNTRAMGHEVLGYANGFNWVIERRDGKQIAVGYDGGGNRRRETEDVGGTRKAVTDAKTRTPREQETSLGRGDDTVIVREGSKTYLEKRGPQGKVYWRTQLSDTAPTPTTGMTPEQKTSNDYWARQAAYYTAKGMGAQRDTQTDKVAQAKAQIQAKTQEAQQKGTTPALEWLSAMPQLAAMAAQPAPEAPRPQYVRPKPRTLSDEEIEIMSNMIAGGMG